MTTTANDASVHPGLIVRIYRVNPKTMQRTLPITRTVPAADGPMITSLFPPCECDRCGGRRASA
ncbi:hypothetical protein ABZ883_39545 [Streptomyces sp. NPDC046977]|uniref:hypothetical protein n=1 Tax=Streptomyces sp. NPDC046977 TaxID=3154703 RepID=UPI0033FECEDA